MLKSKNLILSFICIFCIFCIFYCKQTVSKNTYNNNKNNNIDLLFKEANVDNLERDTKLKLHSKLLNILAKRNNDSITRYYYFKLANRFYNLNDDKSFKLISKILYNLSCKSKDTFYKAKSLKNLGDYYYNLFKNDSAYFYYTKSEKTFESLKNKVDLSEIQLYKSNILLFEKDYLGCEVAIINVLRTAIKKKDYRLIYDCYITLANALDGLNDFEKSLELYNKAFEITKKLENDSQYFSLKSQTYFYIGCLYNKNKDYKKAISYFNKSLKIKKTNSIDLVLYTNFIKNCAYSKFKLGDKLAIVQLIAAFKIQDSLKNIPGIVSSKIFLSEYYLFQNDTVRAFNFAVEAKKTAHDNNIFEDELKLLELLAKIEPKNSKIYNNRFIKLTDSLTNNERATRNKFARIEFETDEILNQKKTIEVEKDAISLRFVYALTTIGLLLIFGVFGYYFIIQRNKLEILEFNQKELQSNNDLYELMFSQQILLQKGKKVEQKRISQELHDGILGKMFGVRFNLYELKNSQDHDTIQNCLLQAKQLQEIELEIRNIAHNLQNKIFSNDLNFTTIIKSLYLDNVNPLNLIFDISIDEKIDWKTIENNVKLNLYRILQQILDNTNKHSHAKIVNLKIEENFNNLLICVRDDGIGFDSTDKQQGIGLKNIKNRVQQINGTLELKSIINKGTIINIKITI